MLHGRLDGGLRRGGGVGDGQLLPPEVVHQRQAAALRLQLLGGLYLPGQQQLVRSEAAEQRLGGQGRGLAVQHPLLPAQRQRKQDHVRRHRVVRRLRTPRQAAGPDGAALLRQQRRQGRLPPVAADHTKGLVHPVSPLMPWYAPADRR